ncbi:hypothetical protein G4D42_17700, partial [Burkholderia pseudomallei]|nr:hypothetical protein [Burkholderia pseudomallei]
MADDNVNVSITVSSDGAEQGASKASDAIGRAVNGIAQDLRELVAQSRATNAALTQGFAQMSSAAETAASRMVQASQRVRAAHEAEAKAAEGASHWTAASRRELLVLGHEMAMGNYKRFAGSIMVLGEQMDWMHKIMTPAGLAIGAVAGSVA